MTAPGYALTAAAEADLCAIIRYTRKQWSDAKVRDYVAKLGEGMARLAARQGAFAGMSALYPALRVAHCARFACHARMRAH